MGDITEKNSSQPVKLVGADSDGNETNYLDINNRGGVNVSYAPTHQVDAFGRLRVSNPTNLFEYTFKYDIDFDWYWSQDTTNGGTVTYDGDKVSRFLNVTGTTGSKSVIQTRRRMEYYAGKSHLFHFSVNFRGANTGIRKRMGLFDNDNGFFFQTDGTTLSVVIRSKVSGSVVDTVIPQSTWNGDRVDGNGGEFNLSEYLADPDNGQLFWIDYAWLGIGGVRYGILLGGEFITLHTEAIANNQADPYAQSPHLPYRLEIENTGGGSADSLSGVCCAFEVEGVASKIGKIRNWYQGNTAETISGEEIVYIGRINPNNKYASARFEKIKAVVESGNDELVFRVYQNPTFTSTVTWTDVEGSIMQVSDDPNSESINTSTGNVTSIDIIRTDGVLELNNTDVFFGFDTNDTSDIFVITADSLNGSADLVMNVATREFY